MADSKTVASQLKVEVDGTELQAQVFADLLEVIVDQSVHLPGTFSIRLYDQGLEYIGGTPLDLTKEIEISASDEAGANTSLIKGEITTIEPVLEEGMQSELIVRGYVTSHRLYREKIQKAYLNVKDSDLASEFASAAGLSPEVETTDTVYEHIYVDNQTRMEFLMQRAWRIGYECYVDDGKLYFRKPPSSGPEVTLKWGEDLISFRARTTLAEQVDEVQVIGWDPQQKAAFTGRASDGNLYAKNGESQDGMSWASTFGAGKMILVDQAVLNTGEAEKMAQARLDEISGAFVQAEGVAFRRPDIRAGKFVKLENIGRRYNGNYYVTNAVHRYAKDGLFTTFYVRGARTGMLAEELFQQPPVKRWPGVVTAEVTNTDDPDDWGRVKVKYPWMTDDAESFWARLAGPGGGPEAGFICVPEVGDEVIVAFEFGDINRPVVLGGLWNGQNAIPPEAASGSSGERPQVREWRSLKGHYMVMHDNADDKIEIVTAGGSNLLIDDANKKIELKTSGGHKMEMDDNSTTVNIETSGGHKVTMDSSSVTIESTGTMSIKAAASLKIEAAMIDIEASGIVNIKGSLVNLN